MNDHTEDKFRARLYGGYVASRETPLAPDTISDLGPKLAHLRRMVKRHFPPDLDAKVLDLGCGHGTLLFVLEQLGYVHVHGIDRSAEQVDAAQRLGILGVRSGDLIEELRQTESRSLDVVVAYDVLEHFNRGELLELVDLFVEKLKPGGRCVIHVPNGESPFVGRVRYGDLTHELAFTRVSLNQLLLSAGFCNVSCFEDTPVVHGIVSAVRWGLWKLIRGVMWLVVTVESPHAGRGCILSQNLLAVARTPTVASR
jgi:SAM-dependent methyltransferase